MCCDPVCATAARDLLLADLLPRVCYRSIKGKPIDHSTVTVGFGSHPQKGDYWIIKNSWGTAFANGGYINVARGVQCAGLCGSDGICGNLFAAGDPAAYFER